MPSALAGRLGRRSSDRLTDSSENVPSGSNAGMSTALCRAYTPGLGSGVARAALADAVLGQLALVLPPLETLPVGQHHRTDGRGDQQRAGEFEGPHVADEDRVRPAPSTLPPALAW